MWGFIVTAVIDLIKGWFAVRQDRVNSERAVHQQIQTQTVTDTTLRVAQLLSFRNANFLRTADFFILLLPYIACIWAPDAVANYFQHISQAIPAWFQYITVGAFYTIWGLGKHLEYQGRYHV